MSPTSVSRVVLIAAASFFHTLGAQSPSAIELDLRAVPDHVAPEVINPRRTGPSAVRASAVVDGRTPALIGYNMGVHRPGNNVTAWLRYAEINAARHWWSQDSWPARPSVWRAKENTLARFERARSDLRAAPSAGLAELEAAILADHDPLPPGTHGTHHSLSEMRRIGLTPLVQINHNTRRYPFHLEDGAPDWHGRWSYWRGVYLVALHLASTYGVERFQLFNEPDHPNSKHISQSEYVLRHQIGSDALHAAIADAGRDAGRPLSLRIGAPVTAGLLVFEKRSGRPDTRDLEVGWGELITRHRTDLFPGRGEDYGSLYNVYSFQAYGRDPQRLLEGIPRLRSLVAAGNGGKELPIIATEVNVSTAANFGRTSETLDSPSYYAPFGAIAAAYVNAGMDELYIFRHTQQPDSTGNVKKNGTHLVGLADPLQNIVASTRGAEVVRFLARGFQGARTRFAPPGLEGGLLHAAAAKNEIDRTHHLLLTHLDRQGDNIPVDLSAWDLPAGALVTAEEVSETHHGDLRHAFPLPADGRFSLTVSASSVTLVNVRPAVSGRVSATRPLTVDSRPGRLLAPALKDLAPSSRVVLALRALPVEGSTRVQIRGGDGDPIRAEVLGHIIPTAVAGERLVDVTRHFIDAAGAPSVLQVVGEGSPASGPEEAPSPATVLSAELRIYDAR